MNNSEHDEKGFGTLKKISLLLPGRPKKSLKFDQKIGLPSGRYDQWSEYMLRMYIPRTCISTRITCDTENTSKTFVVDFTISQSKMGVPDPSQQQFGTETVADSQKNSTGNFNPSLGILRKAPE